MHLYLSNSLRILEKQQQQLIDIYSRHIMIYYYNSSVLIVVETYCWIKSISVLLFFLYDFGTIKINFLMFSWVERKTFIYWAQFNFLGVFFLKVKH